MYKLKFKDENVGGAVEVTSKRKLSLPAYWMKYLYVVQHTFCNVGNRTIYVKNQRLCTEVGLVL